jgi:NADH-quinone oxidoreductase E subunit
MSEGNGAFPPEHLKEHFERVVARYPKKSGALIPLLMVLQKEYRQITPDLMESIAGYLDVTPAHVLGVVTFYTMFSQRKRGRNHLYVCKTLPCWLRGAEEIVRLFEEKLGVKANSGETTEDGEFSIETAECLGVCEQAPCVLVGDRRFGNITRETVDRIIEELRA